MKTRTQPRTHNSHKPKAGRPYQMTLADARRRQREQGRARNDALSDFRMWMSHATRPEEIEFLQAVIGRLDKQAKVGQV
jgi:hypothetical protein